MRRWFVLAAGLCAPFWLAACGAFSDGGGSAASAAAHGALEVHETHEAHGSPRTSGAQGSHDKHDDGHGHGHGEALATEAKFTFRDGKLVAGVPATLDIRIVGVDGRPIPAFAVSHEKLMHLIVVSEDLQRFEHLHPEYKGDGLFAQRLTFPVAGRYKLFADYVPEGGSAAMSAVWVEAAGAASASAPPARPAPDTKLEQTVSGTKIALSVDGAVPGGEAALTFTLTDAGTKKPADGMEPVLGAAGHIVIVSEDVESYLHVHPADGTAPGPSATFRTSFPSPGVYKIWAQFQRNGTSLTAAYTIAVPAAP